MPIKIQKFKRTTAFALIVSMFLSVLSMTAFAIPNNNNTIDSKFHQLELDKFTEVSAIVEFEGETLLSAEKAMGKMSQDQRRVFLNTLNRSQNSMIEKLTALGGVNVTGTYNISLNAISITATIDKLAEIENISFVKGVYINEAYKIEDCNPKTQDSIINTVGANVITGASKVNSAGFTGDGILVGVIDSELNYNHKAFNNTKYVQNPVLTEEKANAFITDLGKGAYYNEKIPFLYDAYGNDNITMGRCLHGSHVCSILAGYCETDDGAMEFSGAAPGAQLAFIKASSNDDSGYVYTDAAIMGFEILYMLDVDLINCSFGVSGYSRPNVMASKLIGNIGEAFHDMGIPVFFSAGNSDNQYANGRTEVVLSDGNILPIYSSAIMEIDVLTGSTINSPSMGVASADNIVMVYDTTIEVDGNTIAYSDSSTDPIMQFSNIFNDTSIEYVPIPGTGGVSDYADVDVAGKIALVRRGAIEFEKKMINAAEAGAVGIVVYDNVPTTTIINMVIEKHRIPAIFVSGSSGEIMLATENKALTVSTNQAIIPHPTALKISEFSSHGPSSLLDFEPTITGIGDMVYGVNGATDDEYMTLSGTSMSCPNVVGNVALVLQYLRETYTDTYNRSLKGDLSEYAMQLIEATAEILTDESGVPFSPRLQGAGLINAASAIAADEVFYIDNPLNAMGDNSARNTSYSFTTALKAKVDDELLYNATLALMIPSAYIIEEYELPYYSPEHDELVYIDQTEGVLNGTSILTFDFDLADISYIANILSGFDHVNQIECSLAEFLNTWPIGTFLEGYVMVEIDGLALHSTHMGFFGDWTKGKIIESYDSIMQDTIISILVENGFSTSWLANTMKSTGLTLEEIFVIYFGFDLRAPLFTTDVLVYNNTLKTPKYYVAGCNAYEYIYNPESPSKIMISNVEINAEALVNTLRVQPGLVRDCSNVVMVVYDPETMEIYYVNNACYCSKNYATDVGVSDKSTVFDWSGLKHNKEALPNNTTVKVDFFAWVEYNHQLVEHMLPAGVSIDDGLPLAEVLLSDSRFEAYKYLTYDVTIDTESPEILYEWDRESATLRISVTDNKYIQYVGVFDEDGVVIKIDGEKSIWLYDDAQEGLTYTYELDLSYYLKHGYDIITIEAVDYAFNNPTIKLDMREARSTNIPVKITLDGDPVVFKASTPYLYSGLSFTVEPYDGFVLAEDFTITAEGYDIIDLGDGLYLIPELVGDVVLHAKGITDIGSPKISYTLLDGANYVYSDLYDIFMHLYRSDFTIDIEAYDPETDKMIVNNSIFYAVMKPETLENIILSVYEDGMDENTLYAAADSLIPWNCGNHLSVTENGTYVVLIKAVDESGNISYLKTELVSLDRVNPIASLHGINFDVNDCIVRENGKLLINVADDIGLSPIIMIQIDGDNDYSKQITHAIDDNHNLFTRYEYMFTIDLSDLSHGENNITVTITDIAGNTSRQTFIVHMGHVPVTDIAIPSTCTETGLTEGSHCALCNEILIAQKIIPVNGHTYASNAEKSPTCTEAGHTHSFSCSVCGDIFIPENTIEALGHTVVIDAAKDATCTENGLTEGKHCSVCGEILIEQKKTKCMGHVPGEWETVIEAQNGVEGVQVRHCTACDAVVETRNIIIRVEKDYFGVIWYILPLTIVMTVLVCVAFARKKK